jgi:hypothetical protein
MPTFFKELPENKMKRAFYLKLILSILVFLMPLSPSFSTSQYNSYEIPVKPSYEKVSKTKKTKSRKKSRNNYRLPKERIWGIWSLATGGYLIVFAIFSALFFIGFYFYLYLLALLLILLIFGIYLTANGVSVIDRSYIHYSDNPELKAERIRPTILRDFIFAGIMTLAILGLILIQFYLSAWLCLIAVLSIITVASLKLSAIKKAKK